MTKKPIAVMTSDVHYSLSTLELADKSMRLAIDKADELGVPLIVAGDLHDSKANMRAECVNAMLDTFFLRPKVDKYILRGNHDQINEKSESHALNFLESSAVIVDQPTGINANGSELQLIPYHHDLNTLREELAQSHHGILIMHQGLNGSDGGEYIQDKTALNPSDVAGRRVISGHYHKRQDIELPDGGLWSYIGNPYTVNYAEANDPEKGFRILYNDGSLDFVPTNLRKHVVMELDYDIAFNHDVTVNTKPDDLLWVKLSGTREDLNRVVKDKLRNSLKIPGDFRLDLIPHEIETTKPAPKVNRSFAETLEELIDSMTNVSTETKERLKQMGRDLKK